MNSVCPFCGGALDPQAAAPGWTPGTCLCPHCGQEMDIPRGDAPVSPPPPAPEPRPGPAAATPPGEGRFTPPPPLDPPPVTRDDSPAWEGEDGGFVARLWGAAWQVLLHPVRTMAAPARPGLGWALSFALVMGSLGYALNIFWGAAFDWSWSAGFSDRPWLELLLSPLLVLIGLFVGGALTHASLWVLRGARGGFQATFRAIAYSHAAYIFYLIPGLGVFLGGAWALAAAVGGLSGAHGIGRWRAFFALNLPCAVLCVLVFMALVMFGVLAAILASMSGAFDI